MQPQMRHPIRFTSDYNAIQIPEGNEVEVPEGSEGFLVQAMGGVGTIRIPEKLWQVQVPAEDRDVLVNQDGSDLEVEFGEAPELPDEAPDDADQLRDYVNEQLEQVYDPEIPVNIVELGLVYDVVIEPADREFSVEVRMTLTAPGCGMGSQIAGEAERRIQRIPGVDDADVDIVWDPQWTPDMMSEEARQELGFA